MPQGWCHGRRRLFASIRRCDAQGVRRRGGHRRGNAAHGSRGTIVEVRNEPQMTTDPSNPAAALSALPA
jgi:hypothetical protein